MAKTKLAPTGYEKLGDQDLIYHTNLFATDLNGQEDLIKILKICRKRRLLDSYGSWTPKAHKLMDWEY